MIQYCYQIRNVIYFTNKIGVVYNDIILSPFQFTDEIRDNYDSKRNSTELRIIIYLFIYSADEILFEFSQVMGCYEKK